MIAGQLVFNNKILYTRVSGLEYEIIIRNIIIKLFGLKVIFKKKAIKPFCYGQGHIPLKPHPTWL